MSLLTPEQIASYRESGYLLVSGLIPDAVSKAAEDSLWRESGASPDDPATWGKLGGHGGFESPELVACYTPEFLEAAQILAEDEGPFHPPKRGYALNVLPSEGEWRWPGPHIDHAIKEHGHKVFPRAFRIAAMTFLSDVPPHGGGTVVWPGGFRQIRTLAESDPVKYEYMWVLNQDWNKLELAPPVETTPRRGDVLFYHYLCPHAGSKNVSNTPRLAMNMKW